MTEGEMLIVCGLDGDPEDPMVAVTTPGTNVGQAVKTIAGVGNPYYAFLSLPFDYSNGIAVDFEGAPLVSNTVGDNNAAIIVMLETPPLDKVSAPA
jgi:hypothetical protein